MTKAKKARKESDGIPYETLQENLDWYSEALSKSVRATAFGIVGAIWAIFTADGIGLGPVGLFGTSTSVLVTTAFVFSGGALLVDLLQYIAALWMTNIGMDRWDASEKKGKKVEFYYDLENLGRLGVTLYRLNYALFPVKLLLAVGGGVTFFFLAFAITVKGF